MGVIYKLREEVVDFIVSQRQSNPLASCRQLAESTSQKFGLNLSKSSVHDVLKESGITTPRGRKPKNKFEIPQEKKKQIQVSLSQIKLGPPAQEIEQSKVVLIADVASPQQTTGTEISTEYDGAGQVFLKAALWDLGIFSEENIKSADWEYYLTYSKGINVFLENNKNIFIELRLPLERCIREVADCLINNIKIFNVNKISDETSFKSCMDAQKGFNITKITIVDGYDHILSEFTCIMEIKRNFIVRNRIFVENNETDMMERSKSLFFPQTLDNAILKDKIMSLRGFDALKMGERTITLLIDDGYERIAMLKEAADKLNNMFLYDDRDRLVKIEINAKSLRGDIAVPNSGI